MAAVDAVDAVDADAVYMIDSTCKRTDKFSGDGYKSR